MDRHVRRLPHPEGRVRRVAIVLADEEHGQPLDTAKLRLSWKIPSSTAPSPKNVTATRSSRSIVNASADPTAVAIVCPRIAEEADESGIGIVQVYGAATAARTARLLAVELGHHPRQVATLGEVVGMTPMPAVDHIVPPQRRAHADRHRLLSDGEVGRRPHLAFGVEIADRLLDGADADHLPEQPPLELQGNIHAS